MFPGMNSRKAAQMMKKMGIQQVEISATEVIIKTPEKEIIITEPQVSKINMMGQETFQIIGNINERELSTEPEINEEDIKTVMEQADVTEEEAKKAIEDSEGDLAKAILSLKKD
ncbi:nascent polypeptide-associated complex protein [Candidatus Woesearchaeota archaeon CG_4_10_14_0_2_um_filter_33_10]|nr:MAG: nascent polypeptide-associated complex protein [Candidatus Woesearchaeota archaeon CG10_big_fil_rev_8_21_14_0_10_33_12]PIU72634.1 MAG: nascent polypeptide-associated complex protein [Candidatus Woesearchaeota archaeon CG06_land_8_20_14_3_00_33_13]PIZ52944.1 MAG: nascent polypeptide-associated complex protein [Candidatus Woesearchaeota archaeon CG_4_10_14_0_2_um_filter_33_10]